MCSFSPAPWAPGPYSQTLFANLSTSAAPDYERVFVETDDGARVAVDWVHGDDLTEDSTVLLVLPGIGKGSCRVEL